MKIGRLAIVSVFWLAAVKIGLSDNISILVTDDDYYWQTNDAVRNDLVSPRHLQKQTGAMQYTRPNLPNNYQSAEGHFLIHYTLEGADAVDSTITNADGVPDYVFEAAQIAERSYRLLIDTLGFQAPPVDEVDNPETDFYIINYGGNYYAETIWENLVTSTPDQLYDWTTYVQIDNDYKEYATTGLAALQVTIAHEYFHVVQLGYNWFMENDLPGSTYGDTYFLEWCSTWMEERAYPEVDDYFNYVYAFFYSPTKSLWNFDYAYALGPFLRYILDLYGEDLLSKIWNRIKSTYAFESLQDVLRDERGVELADLWSDFYYKCYFTGNRYDPDLALSADAQKFPLLSIPTANKTVLDESAEFVTTVAPFASVPYQVTFDQNWFCGINVSTATPDDFLGRYLLVKHEIGKISETLSYNQNLPVGNVGQGDSLLVFMTNNNVTSSRNLTLMVAEVGDIFQIASQILNVYPNPCLLGESEFLTVELQIGRIVRSVKATIFDLRGRRVYEQSFGNGLINIGPYQFSINGADLRSARLASGVYLLRIEIGTKAMTRKILLLK